MLVRKEWIRSTGGTGVCAHHKSCDGLDEVKFFCPSQDSYLHKARVRSAILL